MFRRLFILADYFFLLLTCVYQGSQDGCAQCAEDDGQGNGNRDMHPVHNQHLDTDKAQHEAKPYLRKIKRSAKSASKKYMARRPKMAKMLEVRTMKGSVVTAKIAGMLSRRR